MFDYEENNLARMAGEKNNFAPILSEKKNSAGPKFQAPLNIKWTVPKAFYFALCCVSTFFSSPEPKAQVSYCHSAPSVVRPSVVRPSVNFHIFDFSSETAERNSTKLDRKQSLNTLYRVCVFRADRKNKMAALASDWLRHFRLLL